MSADEPQEPTVEAKPVVGLNGRPAAYPEGTWEALVGLDGQPVRDAAGRLIRVR